jgi:hypothetical protein
MTPTFTTVCALAAGALSASGRPDSTANAKHLLVIAISSLAIIAP